MKQARDDLFRQRKTIREDLGGKEKVAHFRAQGRLTARDRLTRLVDDGSFMELGTFVKSENPEDRPRTPGDGLIGGLARISGRPVVTMAHDITVKAGSGGRNGQRKLRRLYQHALSARCPLVLLGEGAGARIPDILGSEAITGGESAALLPADRRRQVPMVTAIVGRSYGESSFLAAQSDVVIQVSGTVMAVASPRVIEVATGEAIEEEQLGGRSIQETEIGQIDLGVDSEEEAFAAIRRVLSYLPDNCWERAPMIEAARDVEDFDEVLPEIVPESRRRAYDMKKVIERVVDPGGVLELRPGSGRSAVTALARIGGRSVGIVANQPIQMGGAITPEACDKMVRFTCLCDAYNLPIVSLIDTPGFLVGSRVERDRLLFKSTMLVEALYNSHVPRISVILRKAFGLGLFAMSGSRNVGADAVLAWPGAELNFMDPEVAANVVYGDQLAKRSDEERDDETLRIVDELRNVTSSYGGAVHMGIDEVIDPAETAYVIREFLDRLDGSFTPGQSVLRDWPNCW